MGDKAGVSPLGIEDGDGEVCLVQHLDVVQAISQAGYLTLELLGVALLERCSTSAWKRDDLHPERIALAVDASVSVCGEDGNMDLLCQLAYEFGGAVGKKAVFRYGPVVIQQHMLDFENVVSWYVDSYHIRSVLLAEVTAWILWGRLRPGEKLGVRRVYPKAPARKSFVASSIGFSKNCPAGAASMSLPSLRNTAKSAMRRACAILCVTMTME